MSPFDPIDLTRVDSSHRKKSVELISTPVKLSSSISSSSGLKKPIEFL